VLALRGGASRISALSHRRRDGTGVQCAPFKENTVSDNQSPNTTAAAQPFERYTPVQVAQHKKDHDARRKAIRDQNTRSKSLK